ncbi:EthD domain-containing protein [Rhizorhabdus argentea]|uniref:EthD domain-containing protein n=1 Tax=Rhizorhabdus argentea TaxID=1387174 RepID=UPI0030EDFA1B
MQRMVVFMKRKRGMSHEDFVAHYENVHIPLNEKWIGPFMSGFIRIYPSDLYDFLRGAESDPAKTTPGCDYDAVSIYTIKDETARDELIKVAQDPEFAREISEDEEKFTDRGAGRYGLATFFQGKGLNGAS